MIFRPRQFLAILAVVFVLLAVWICMMPPPYLKFDRCWCVLFMFAGLLCVVTACCPTRLFVAATGAVAVAALAARGTAMFLAGNEHVADGLVHWGFAITLALLWEDIVKPWSQGQMS